jgi:hypothetical protein
MLASSHKNPIYNLRLLANFGLILAMVTGCRQQDAGQPTTTVISVPVDRPMPAPQPRVIALSRGGDMVSMNIDRPWDIVARTALKETINSVHCQAGVCAVVHPDPVNALTLVDAQNLNLISRFDFAKSSDPRDVTFTDDHTLVVSFYNRNYLLELNSKTGYQRTIKLTALADSDGLPESNMLASCGKQVYVQLQRLDHKTTLPGKEPALIAIVDTDKQDQLQTIPLALTPALDMRINCQTRELIVAEPQSIIQGGGDVEKINLNTRKVSSALAEGEFANGGILRISQHLYWLNQHTDTGPGPSSHLSLVGGASDDVYNVFANEHVDNFVYDSVTHWLFYPNPCSTIGSADCDNGVHVFDGLTGASTGNSIDPGFAPIEVTISR